MERVDRLTYSIYPYISNRRFLVLISLLYGDAHLLSILPVNNTTSPWIELVVLLAPHDMAYPGQDVQPSGAVGSESLEIA
jgi:hypothetical protein